jgi:protein-S-isoprenylcysteine O-methyltransferase Ste14
MRATNFEFEYRFFIIGFIIFAGFFSYNFDRMPFSVALLHLVAPSISTGGALGFLWLRFIIGAGAGLVFLAALFRTWATAYLRTEVVHDAPLHAEALVADGPYRHVCNPLYFANVPMAVGFGLMASRPGFFLLVLGMWLFLLRLIGREEEELLKTQGDSYRAYLSAVPRFWPSLAPKLPPAGRRPRWGQAIAGEMFIWIFGIAELTFAITLNLKISGIVCASGFVVYFIAVALVKKRAAQSAPSA